MSNAWGGRAFAALLVGAVLGAITSAGTALLLYTGQGFLRAAGLLLSSTIMAIAAGLWGGTPEQPAARVATRGRWVLLILALIMGGLFASIWGAREPLRTLATGGAFAVLLALALPAYAAGSLLAALHAHERALLDRRAAGILAALTTAGAAIGVLLATSVLIPRLEAYGIYYGAATAVTLASLLERTAGVPRHRGGDHMHGRVALITGAGDRGQLAWTVAQRFLQAGAQVVLSARSTAVEELVRELAQHGDIIAVQADLTNDADVDRLMTATRERFGRLDALLNIAGGLTVMHPLADTTPEEWQRELERNAETVLRTSRAALPLLRESHGAIINFASPAGLRAVAGLGAYSAAKAAVIALTRALALEEKRHGVRVNAIAPGTMDTAQNRQASGEDQSFVPRDDVASVALFLASDAARAVSGETIRVMGATLA